MYTLLKCRTILGKLKIAELIVIRVIIVMGKKSVELAKLIHMKLDSQEFTEFAYLNVPK